MPYQQTVTTTQPAQLRQELQTALPQYQYVLIAPTGSPNQYVFSYDETLTSTDIAIIQSTIANHTPDPLFDVPEGQIWRDGSTLDIVNTIAETTLFSFPIAAGSTADNTGFRLALLFDYLNNSGATRTIRLRLKLGGVTIYDDVTGNIQANAARRSGIIETSIIAINSTSQVVSGWMSLSAQGITTAGLGNLGTQDIVNATFSGTASANLSQKQVFTATITHSIANANLSFRRRFATLQRL